MLLVCQIEIEMPGEKWDMADKKLTVMIRPVGPIKYDRQLFW